MIRPEDTRVAARTLARLAKRPPAFLSWPLRTAIRIGGIAAPLLPGVVVPIARAVLRRMVAHLVIDATDPGLGRALRRIRAAGARPNVNLLGEAVLGAREADRRLAGTRRLLARSDVDYVSIKVSATVTPHTPWAFDEAVDDIVTALTPLFEEAASASPAKFVNLDMEEYKDLDLTIAVFQRLLDQPQLRHLEAGIVLQAYLPDALGAYLRLRDWARARRAAGGAGIKVRVVKGANLPMERVDASLHDWPLATWGSKQQSDTNYKRVLDVALRPENVDDVRIGVAGHNLFDLAYARHLARSRGVEHAVEIEMLLGMAPAPGGGRAARCRRAAALHAGRRGRRLRFGDRLPHPAARGGGQLRQLHVGRVRVELVRRPVRARARPLPRLARRRRRRGAGAAPGAGPHAARRRGGARIPECARQRSRRRREPCLGTGRSRAVAFDRARHGDRRRLDDLRRRGCRPSALDGARRIRGVGRTRGGRACRDPAPGGGAAGGSAAAS